MPTEARCHAVLDVCARIGLTVIATPSRRLRSEDGVQIGQGELYGSALRLQRVGKAKVAR
jgi:hypothetical protein